MACSQAWGARSEGDVGPVQIFCGSTPGGTRRNRSRRGGAPDLGHDGHRPREIEDFGSAGREGSCGHAQRAAGRWPRARRVLVPGCGQGDGPDRRPAGGRQTQPDAARYDVRLQEGGGGTEPNNGRKGGCLTPGARGDRLEGDEAGSGPLRRGVFRDLDPERLSSPVAQNGALNGERRRVHQDRSCVRRRCLRPECRMGSRGQEEGGRRQARSRRQHCMPDRGHRLRTRAWNTARALGHHKLQPEIRQHQDGLRVGRSCGLRAGLGRIGRSPTRLVLAQEVDGKFFLLFLVSFPVGGRAELLILQLAQGADLLAAVETLHAGYGIG